ncbi:hypothetical protein [Nocardia implantans]|uniref:Uncharacterized protein n=1 Tax=Nocardia implantans TaxID=3108168 RepID=A0ABU6B1Y9_9NOCA|nr:MULTISPECIES: hypothetical protein [unclassified Nocardia]MBF6194967.1 hypothetical protein [Nocardia beijingensis]MEA3530372.1 hypothetical protein [Nocardia sp. CDC192]MEB3513768.1 hypothetical protein [Nocardia sp. CDC186]
MESSRAKIAGPAIAAGAVSIGLVLIGACGVGRQDTYVPPPPLKAGEYAEPVVHEDTTGSTTPKVVIPPSPTWRIAPADQRRPTPFAGFMSSTTAEPSPGNPHEDTTQPSPPDEPRPTAARAPSSDSTDEAPTQLRSGPGDDQ